MSVILDNITGGGLLPHVYCRKVTLENSSEEGMFDVTLLLELYQDKNALASSTWLNDLGVDGFNFLDAMFIQVLPYKEKQNVMKMLPSNNPLEAHENVYTGKHHFGDHYLPRGTVNIYAPGFAGVAYVAEGTSAGQIFQSYDTPPVPIQISNSSLIGNIAKSNVLRYYEETGKIREEIVNGKPYYVIPFEHKTIFDPSLSNNNLGFTFYTFLHVPYWIKSMGMDYGADQDFFEEFVVEGPINTEVVFMNGKAQQTREAFFLPDGRVWEGSVHLHGPNNKAPSGYFGDGDLSGLHPGAPQRGWMVGEEHNSVEEQPRLRLAKVANNKLSDFRGTGVAKGPMLSETLGLSEKQEQQLAKSTAFDQMLNVFDKSGFQKEKKKDFWRAEDNDSEYSKLYVSRDRDGNARGMFFINLEELIKNNSTLYQTTSGTSVTSGMSEFILSILTKSNFLELKLYRDRIKEHLIGNRRENYSNDEAYEEPSKLIGTIGSYQYGNQTQINEDSIVSAVIVDATGMSVAEKYKIRYFTFVDYDVSKQAAGLYQYRLEIEFKDGTYEFLYELYKDLANAKTLLQHYYDLAVSSYTDSTTAGFTYTVSGQKEEYSKSVFKKYYKNGAYVDQFNLKAQELFVATAPWLVLPPLLTKAHKIFLGLQYWTSAVPDLLVLYNNLDPVSGAPKGIEHISKIVNIYMRKLEVLLSINKVKKAGSGLTGQSNANAQDSTSLLRNIVSPASSTISEQHTFEDPRELFQATSNKNIYVDYLSAVTNHTSISANQAMRVLAAPDYRVRCELETAKFNAFPGRFYTYNIHPWTAVPGAGPGGGLVGQYEQNDEDFLSNMGFSYLAPSIIELSDSPNSENDKGYNFKYSVFSNNPLPYLNAAATLPASSMITSVYSNVYKLDSLLINLLNYTFNKENVKDTDLLDSSFSYKKFGLDVLEQRESYKRTFEEMGMTLHDTDQHKIFFQDAQGHEREAGAVSIDIPEFSIAFTMASGMPKIGKYNYTLNDFSDKDLFPKDFFVNFLRSNKQGFIKLKNNSLAYGYSKDLPNSFKFYAASTSAALAASAGYNAEESLAQPVWDFALNNPSSPIYDSFIYFNLNLTVKIEVFRGISGNAKNDEESWTLLTEADLTNSGGMIGMMFCRMSYYDEKLVRGIKLPMLDKYFLISPGELTPFAAAVAAVNAETQYDSTGADFWAKQNEQKMEDYADETGQNLDPGGGFQGAGAGNMTDPWAAAEEAAAAEAAAKAAADAAIAAAIAKGGTVKKGGKSKKKYGAAG